MAEYMDGKALLNDLGKLNCALLNKGGPFDNFTENYQKGFEKAVDYVRRFPVLSDVAPVVHGRWELLKEPDGKPYCFRCSACGKDMVFTGWDYCPNCGAKMDLESDT